jgi:protein O-mannosyl-transferase
MVQKPERWFLLALVLLVAVLYWPTLDYSFVNFDDPVAFSANPHVKAGLTLPGLAWAFSSTEVYWQPLVHLSHMAVVSLFGPGPGPAHFANALLHAANAALFLLLLRRLGLALAPALAAAALFALHPLRVESVAWITERKDVLSAFFWLLTLLAYVHYVAQPTQRVRYLRLLLCYLLGLMSKPTLVMLPVALLLLDLWPLRRPQPLRQRIVEKLPLAALAALIAIVTYFAQQASGAVSDLALLPFDQRFANAIYSYAFYLVKSLWPSDLAILYVYPASYPPLTILAAAAFLVGLTYAAWRTRLGAPWWLAGWLWFLLTLLPNIGLIQAGSQPYADRFTYLPSLLPCAALAYAAHRALGESPFRWAAAALAAALTLGTALQLPTWQDDFTVYQHAIAVNPPGAPLVHLNLGAAYESARRYPDAIKHYQNARRLDPALVSAHLNLGLVYLAIDRPQEALEPLTRAVALRPSAQVLFNYGRALLGLGQIDEAVRQTQLALRQSPTPGLTAELHAQLGLAAYMQQRDAAALASFQESLRWNPQFHPARRNAGIALGNLGRNREAIEQLEIYLAAQPNDAAIRAAVAALRQSRP